MAITDWFNKPASNAMLDNSFRNQFYQSNVQPVQSGATNVRPTNMAALKNWTPWKAFMPQSMGGTFYTGGTPQALGALNTAKNFGLGALRFSGLTNPVGAAAMSAWAAPKLINALTERDPDATKSSLFGIDLTRNANEQAALPDVGANPWGSPMGDIPVAGDDIQEQVTETETIDPYETDPYGTEHHYVTPDKKRSFGLSRILKGLKNQFQRPEEKQAAYEAIMGDRKPLGLWNTQSGNYGGNKYTLQRSPTGLKVYSEVNPYGKNFDSAFGSKSLEEMDEKTLAWAMDRLSKGKNISSRLTGILENRGRLDGSPGDGGGATRWQPDYEGAVAHQRGFSFPNFGLSGILKGLKNQFKINPEKQKEFDSWEENKDQTGWGSIGDTGLKGNIYEGPGGKKFSLFDPTTGYNVLQNKNWRGGTGKSLQEQINEKNAWIADRLFTGKGLSKKAHAYAKLNKLGTYGDQGDGTDGGTPPGGWQPDYEGAVAHQQQMAAEAGQTHEQFMSDLNEVRAKGGRVGYLDGGLAGLAYLLYGGLV